MNTLNNETRNHGFIQNGKFKATGATERGAKIAATKAKQDTVGFTISGGHNDGLLYLTKRKQGAKWVKAA